MYSLIDLSALVAFSELGSIRQAAVQLHRTQPAITQAIQRLEEAVGFELLDRSGYRARLSARGELFLKRARKMLQEGQDLRAYANVLAMGNEPVLRLAMNSALPSQLWVDLVAHLPEEYPNTVLELRAEEGRGAVRRLLEEGVDLALVVGEVSNSYALEVEHCLVGYLKFVTIASMKLCGEKGEMALENNPQILVADFDDPDTRFGVVEGQPYWRVSHFSDKVAAIKAGLGWGSVPRWMVEDDLQNQSVQAFSYRGIGPESKHPIYLVKRHNEPQGPVALSLWHRAIKREGRDGKISNGPKTSWQQLAMAADSKNNQWTVYMIETRSGKLYTGITTDVDRRFNEHLSSPTKGAKFFRSDKPKRVVYQECCDDRSGASQREAAIKALTRRQKLQLIAGES